MIRRNLDYAAYATLPGWRWSHIRLLERGSLVDVRHAQENPEDGDTAARRALRAIHCAVLEPESYRTRYSTYDGVRRGKAFDAHCVENPGAEVLSPREAEDAEGVAAAIEQHPEAARLLRGGDAELSLDWTDEASGLPCLGRPDYVGPAGIVDLKGAGTFEGAITRLCATQGWHAQLAHYDAGARANGIPPRAHWLITYQTHAPYDVAVWQLDETGPDGALFHGRRLRERLLRRAVLQIEREAAGEWMGRHARVQDLWLPEWALNDETALTFGGNPVAAETDADEEVKAVWMSRPI